MILPDGPMGRAGLTLSRASLADAGALAAAALTAARAPGPARIRLLRSLGSDVSAAERSITDLPSTSPKAAPLPFSNIISFMVRLLGSGCRPASCKQVQRGHTGACPRYPPISERRSMRHDGSR